MMLTQYETQLKYRAVDENGDMVFGAGQAGFLEGLAAMTQMLKTRLAAGEGEWWEDDPGALPYFTEILGSIPTEEKRQMIDLLVIDRIMNTIGVNGISNIKSYIENRHYHFTCTVSTVYGDTEVSM